MTYIVALLAGIVFGIIFGRLMRDLFGSPQDRRAYQAVAPLSMASASHAQPANDARRIHETPPARRQDPPPPAPVALAAAESPAPPRSPAPVGGIGGREPFLAPPTRRKAPDVTTARSPLAPSDPQAPTQGNGSRPSAPGTVPSDDGSTASGPASIAPSVPEPASTEPPPSQRADPPLTPAPPSVTSAASTAPPDDLKAIKGVGPKLEGILHENGVFRFEQIARWTSADVANMDDKLQFHGRIERDEWIEQARVLHNQKYGTSI
ncbi:MAG: hypothetical protein K0U93_22685 [Gammaproteobacteria bacterium]|nr:hypothetical protein [Gammaproteobacteria bacterium]